MPDILMIAKQGMFSSGGTVTAPVEGAYDATTNWLDAARTGNTAHVDHANQQAGEELQIPAALGGAYSMDRRHCIRISV